MARLMLYPKIVFFLLFLTQGIVLSAQVVNPSGKPVTDTPILHIAVASNFRPAMKKLVPLFERENSFKIQWQSASTGAIFNQISNGAPYDLFLAADSERPLNLIKLNIAAAETLQTYALGKLVWYQPGNSLAPFRHPDKLPAMIAMANPKIAPYGKAAEEVISTLKKQGIVFNKIISATNILQTFQYVYTGNVSAGFVAYAQIINQSITSGFWMIPRDWYSPIKQQAVAIKTHHIDMAKRFLKFLMSERARKIISDMGYNLPLLKTM